MKRTFLFSILFVFQLFTISLFTSCVNDQLKLGIHSIEFSKPDSTITIGPCDDIIIPDLDTRMTVTFSEKNIIKWSLTKPAYLKLNGSNINKHLLENSRSSFIILYDGLQHISSIDNQTLIKQIKIFLKSVKTGFMDREPEYISFQNLLPLKFQNEIKAKLWGDYFTGCNSFIHNENGKLSIVLLDSNLCLLQKGQVIRSFLSDEILNTDKIKIQFFKLTRKDYYQEKMGKTVYHIKPFPILTDFRASFITLARKTNNSSESSTEAMFSSDATACYDVEAIKTLDKANGGIGLLISAKGGIPNKSSIYFPLVTNRYKNDNLLLNSKNQEAYMLMDSVSAQKTELFTLKPDISYHTYKINGQSASFRFTFNYLNNASIFYVVLRLGILMLALIFIVLLFFKKVDTNSFCEIHHRNHRINYGFYFSALLFVLFLFMVMKLYIAFKITNTYPYFNHIFNLNSIIVLILPILLMLLWMSINKDAIASSKTLPIKVVLKIFPSIVPGRTYTRMNKIFVTTFLLLYTLLSYYFLDLKYLVGYFREESSRYSLKVGATDLFNTEFLNDKHFKIILVLSLIMVVLFIYHILAILFNRNSLKNRLLLSTYGMITSMSLLLETAKRNLRKFSLLAPATSLLHARNNNQAVANKEPHERLRGLNWIVVLVHVAVFFLLNILPGKSYQGTIFLLFYLPLIAAGIFRFRMTASAIGNQRGAKTGSVNTSKAQSKNIFHYFVFNLLVFLPFISFVLVYETGFFICLIPALFTTVIFGLLDMFAKVAESWPGYVFKVVVCFVIFIVFYLAMVKLLVFLPTSSFVKEEARITRRAEAFANYSAYSLKGLRYSDQDCEFLAIMSKQNRFITKLHPNQMFMDENAIHPGISMQHSPVVLNDLSPLVGLFSVWGGLSVLVLCAGWGFLLFLINYHIYYRRDGNGNCYPHFGYGYILKFLAVVVLIFSGAYLILCMLGIVPYTGRLIYGLGIDSLSENLETLILFTFMGFPALLFWQNNKRSSSKG
jgi:hypothetical protein